ncbi:hypothetical protein CCACVL1_16175 [Corchorus capsularis]|uniref:Uncharacterized protein n=1 Tax=Corchorus capsularis TaxID=210143 RepID=A0A1R3HYI8_COCAP|nr:hypothetical protein CCACVL1_16175 [Corchorus capsularis]
MVKPMLCIFINTTRSKPDSTSNSITLFANSGAPADISKQWI